MVATVLWVGAEPIPAQEALSVIHMKGLTQMIMGSLLTLTLFHRPPYVQAPWAEEQKQDLVTSIVSSFLKTALNIPKQVREGVIETAMDIMKAIAG